MRFIQLQKAALALSLFAAAGLVVLAPAPAAYAQTAVTGAISGVVADSTGGVVPGATVTVVNTGTNATLTLTTNAQGQYTVPQLSPATYAISATATGLQSVTTQITVLVGITETANITVTPSASKTVVEVSASALPLVDTQNVALATTFNSEQIQNLPTPGGDVTTVAFTAPGVVVNAGGSYGNFSSEGLPGISNLFVLNGFDNQDPFLNLNNSGSSNLTLGQGELAEATVVQNGYNSQYGRAAGAIINYTTKSGTNSFHGMLDYNYNGTLLNSNGWINQYEGLARPHAVSNEWAANVGGPIIKDKVFFFADYEGLRYVLPGSSNFLTFPTPQLQAYILNNVPASAQSFYALALNDFTKSPAYKSAVPVTNGTGPTQDDTGYNPNNPNPANLNPLTGQPGALGCGLAADGGLNGTTAPDGGTFGVTEPCMTVGAAAANNINQEWLFTGRADWNINDHHKIYGRYKMDRGTQPTSTSFIDPLFSAVSIQPEYEGQFNDAYVISPTKTNSLTIAANWYTAYFGPADTAASLAELPMNLYYTDNGFDYSGVNASPGLPSEGVPYYLTQGRNVTQYQIVDDFSWIHGKNAFKFGANFRRDLVSDYDQQEAVIFPYALIYSLGDFAAGNLSSSSPYYGYNQYGQAYTATNTAHLALYNLGVYFQDEWQATSKLKLTLGARVDRTGNPLCHNGCFANYTGTFPGTGTAYNQAINPQTWNAFPGVDTIDFQPRFGINYSIDDKTEIRGGVGLFSDLYPAGFVDGVIQNFPNYNLETIYTGNLNTTGTGTVGSYAGAANQAVQQGFTTGQTPLQIATSLYNQGVPFSPPTVNAYFPGTLREPEYLEYNLQVQRQLGKADAIILTYAGNYGYNEIMTNPWLNAGTGIYGDGTFNNAPLGQWTQSTVGQFSNFPVTPADPRFYKVNAYTNDAHSNYNAGMVTWTHIAHGVTSHLNYTYSHSLDMISNGGTGEPFNGASVTSGQLTPTLGYGNLNYSNSDYDIRNNLTADVVYEQPHIQGHRYVDAVAGGWIIGGKTYYRSGEPFSITNGGMLGALPNTGGTFMAALAPGVTRDEVANPTASKPHSCVFTACMNVSEFVPYADQTFFGTLRRNAFYGPHYVDTDINVMKKIVNLERFTFQIGANAYNIFNRANFAAPNGGTADVSNGAFGQIQGTVAAPTSPYGSFQGAAVTQRLLVIHGKITF
jgi:outer membrane receptor protein involved in Fe transport